MLNQKQNSIYLLSQQLGAEITNIQDYQNKDSVLICKCRNNHTITGSVEYLLKTNFECVECMHLQAIDIKDTTPFFLSLDAATYTTGMSIFNRAGQLLGHKSFIIDKKKEYFVRVKELKEEVERITKENNIQCIILEDIQYQQNPVLFKKLAMLQGVLRYTIIEELQVELITAMADEWRAYNHIYGVKRQEQKEAAIKKAKLIFKDDIPEDESESIFLGWYGIYVYNKRNSEMED